MCPQVLDDSKTRAEAAKEMRLMQLYMCPHAPPNIYAFSKFSYYYTCVLMSLTTARRGRLILLYVSSYSYYYYACVLILLHMCRQVFDDSKARAEAAKEIRHYKQVLS